MNWFDTTGIANLAKTALKEAQKQIDKALDIKDDDDAIETGIDDETPDSSSRAVSATVNKDQLAAKNSEHTDVADSGTGAVSPNDPRSSITTVLKNETIEQEAADSQHVGSVSWGSFTGSFFERPTGSVENVTVTKPPASLKRQSVEDSETSPLTGSPPTEKDSSESIEVLSTITTPISTLASPNLLPSGEATQYDGESESVEVLGTQGTASSVSSPESLTAADQNSPHGQTGNNDGDFIALSSFEMHRGTSDDHEDDISIEDDSMSYTLSEQPVTVMEANSTMSPITVAPTRSGLHLPLPSTFSPRDVKEGVRNISVVETAANNWASSSTARLGFTGTAESSESEWAAGGEAGYEKKPQPTQNDEQDLDRSYENVEIQTQTSDSTQSFEEITPSGSVLDVKTSLDDNEEVQRSRQTAVIEGTFKATASASTMVPEGEEGIHHAGPNLGDDEIETTTSSDIEIISSPNGGDSSSTHSNGAYRTSPLKARDNKSEDIDILLTRKHRGHIREPSEASVHSGNSDESGHQTESERLMRRLAEVSETLEQREYRLVQLGRQNAELQEQNTALLLQLETKAARTSEGTPDSEGYTQRLSALERKFQQAIREKEILKRQLQTLRAEEEQKVARREVDKVLAERDFMIGELQKEGESLSKQVLQHSNIIKKLRAKEKESDALIRKQRDELSELVEEAERLKRSLSAKEEVERSQIDAVHKLSFEKQKLERDCGQLKSNLDDHAQRLETLRKSFDCARKELNEQAESYRELQQRFTKLQGIETEHGKAQKASEQMVMQLEELREQLRRTEQEYSQRFVRAKHEHAELLSRLEATEMRAEEEKNSAASLTIPLMKQLESLQNTLRHKDQVWEQREAAVAKQLADALEQGKYEAERERSHRDQIASLQNRIANLEERLTAALFQVEETTSELMQKQLDVELFERDIQKRLAESEGERLSLSERLHEKELLVSKLEQRLQQVVGSQDLASTLHYRAPDKATVSNLAYHSSQPSSMANETATALASNAPSESPTVEYTASKRGVCDSSPTPSIGNLSLSESLASIPWNATEEETGSLEASTGYADGAPGTGLAPVHLLNNTSLLETLQAMLKQRDGEVHQLQWEVSRFQQERIILNTEISKLTMELDNIREKNNRRFELEEEQMELQKRYDALLQMYGESVEKTEELRLDLVDVKEMYKLQIDDLLRQQRELIATINSSQQASPLPSKANPN
ncbi:TATA element modulatory factor [Anopheles ziemanni]|uniref:TATA element modulatory factor n=1 Tax=Anopheles ziemanni TaxID=345580 RepID=UPI00265E1663|nr:TATA element modulatory factor [Anopheles ziemanni]